jgi:diguanylate cyclase (GGDEF)-like protein
LDAIANPDRPPRCVEYSFTHKDGRELWLEARPTPLIDQGTGETIGVTDVVRDITERKVAETRLEFANVLLTTQMEASPDGILVVDAGMRIISVNQRFADIWNISTDIVALGDHVRVLGVISTLVKHPKDFIARVNFYYENLQESGRDDVELVNGRILERHTVPLLAPSGDSLGRAWFFRDVTTQRQSLAQALKAASQDVLTGLANRAAFVESLHREIAKANRGDKGFAVIFLDLDRFKDVNDTLGHPAGDELLEAVAGRLRANVREADTVARFGGDEFAVIVSDLKDATDLAILAEKLIRVIGEPYSIAGMPVYTGASIGIDLYGPEAADVETLLAHADLALYQAKARGRGRYHFFTAALDTEVRDRVTMAAELREAIAGDELFLLYQPQVSLITGKITGLEALVHWRHPRLGVLAPAAFVQTAEQMSLMASLGHWTLWAAVRQAKAWLDADLPLARLSVNLSALQLKAPLALEADVAAALAETGLPPGRLELELTEAALMIASREAGEVLPRLRRAGVTIAIDEFGDGYASLHHLRRFHVDRIKIAGTFVRNLEVASDDAAIVKATIAFAQGLNIKVMAAGVETLAQFDLLESWGCAEAQGPFLAGPIDAESVAVALADGLQPKKSIEAPGATSRLADAG